MTIPELAPASALKMNATITSRAKSAEGLSVAQKPEDIERQRQLEWRGEEAIGNATAAQQATTYMVVHYVKQ